MSQPQKTSCCVPGHGRGPEATPVPPTIPGGWDKAVILSIPGGPATVGTDRPELGMDGEGPARRVVVAPFRIDAHAVCTARFATFVEATGYRTDAERFGWSFVFQGFLPREAQHEAPEGATWWRKVDGADWAHPEGPGSSTDDRPDHPVVHISWNDAAAFAAWAGGRLPTETEWEYAAKGGDDAARFPWGGTEPNDADTTPCNIWQGHFPTRNTGLDGFVGTAPVDSFAPNGFGLYNACGNVWEWCADRFRVRSLSRAGKARNAEAQSERERVMKGGSYLCHRSYCYRYRIAARSGRSPDTSAGHTGFRVAYDDRPGRAPAG